MKKQTSYSVSLDVARRSGVISSRYRTPDGRFLLTERDLQNMRFRMTAEEFITGLDAYIVSAEEASKLAKEGGYHLGETLEDKTVVVTTAESDVQEDMSEESSEEKAEEVSEEPTVEESEDTEQAEQPEVTDEQSAEEEEETTNHSELEGTDAQQEEENQETENNKEE